MKWLWVTLPILMVVCYFTPAHTQEETTTFGQERSLREVDQKISVLEAKRELFTQVLSQIPTKQRLSQIQIDDKLIAQVAAVESQIKGYLNEVKKHRSLPTDSPQIADSEKNINELWKKLSSNLRSLEESVREQYRSINVISQYSWPLDEKLRMELHRITRTYADDFNQQVQDTEDAVFKLTDAVRDPAIFKLESLASKYLPQLKEGFKTIKPKMEKMIDSIRKGAESERAKVESQLSNLQERQSALVIEIGKKREGQIKIDETILTITLPVFAAVLAVILMGPCLYDKDTRQVIFQSNVVLEMGTVFLLTSTILILGISEKISGEVLGTLIGGISGYVLGRWKRRDEKSSKTKDT